MKTFKVHFSTETNANRKEIVEAYTKFEALKKIENKYDDKTHFVVVGLIEEVELSSVVYGSCFKTVADVTAPAVYPGQPNLYALCSGIYVPVTVTGVSMYETKDGRRKVSTWIYNLKTESGVSISRYSTCTIESLLFSFAEVAPNLTDQCITAGTEGIPTDPAKLEAEIAEMSLGVTAEDVKPSGTATSFETVETRKDLTPGEMTTVRRYCANRMLKYGVDLLSRSVIIQDSGEFDIRKELPGYFPALVSTSYEGPFETPPTIEVKKQSRDGVSTTVSTTDLLHFLADYEQLVQRLSDKEAGEGATRKKAEHNLRVANAISIRATVMEGISQK